MIFHKQTKKIDHRTELAQQEAELLNSLLGLAPAPKEVDSKQVEICGLSLKRKRARALARFEEKQDMVCNSVKPEMETYFMAHPGPHSEGPRADFRQYKKFLSGKIYRKLISWIQKGLTRRR